MNKLFILVLSIVLLIGPSSAHIFDKPIIPLRFEKVIVDKSIGASNPLCALGFVQYCDLVETERRIMIENRYVLEPFDDSIRISHTGSNLDSEDIYTVNSYNLSELMRCSQDKEDLLAVYSCAWEFIHTHDLNCRASASAFKLAILNSEYYKNIVRESSADIQSNFSGPTIPRKPGQEGLGQEESKPFVELYKAFYYDGDIISHRFILLKNENGYYVLDPQQCNSQSLDYCIFLHTKYFYDVKKAINYRGNVYKIDRIV